MKQHNPCGGCRTRSTCRQLKICPIEDKHYGDDNLPEPEGLDEVKTTMSFDDGKPDLTMIDPQFLREISLVLAKGARKYERDNWRHGTQHQRRIASALRHIMAWVEGEDIDPELGTPHLANAATNLMFVMYWARTGRGTDDRYIG